MEKVQLTKVIYVKKIISSRYENNERPDVWDNRIAGVDIILDTDQVEYKLNSTGQQSPPKEGWGILLNEQDSTWTLYSISKI